MNLSKFAIHFVGAGLPAMVFNDNEHILKKQSPQPRVFDQIQIASHSG